MPQRTHSRSTAAISKALTKATWRKSSRSQGSGAECVELASVLGFVAFQDSKAPGGHGLVLTSLAAKGLINSIKTGVHDL